MPVSKKFSGTVFSFCFLVLFVLTVQTHSTSVLPPPSNIRITTIPQLNNEEQVWICPTDSNIIIANWRDFRLGYRQVGIGRSTDGGQNWTDSLIAKHLQVSFDDSWQSDPTLTVDANGNFYISVLDFNQPGGFSQFSYIAFYKSTDKGVSWTGPVVHLSALNLSVFEDKQFITVDRTGGTYDGNLYCTWARFASSGTDANRMAFVRSIDGGASFEDTIIIGPIQSSSNCGSNISSGQFPIPLVSTNGDVHCFWLATVIDSGVTCSAHMGIKHIKSIDGGQTFGATDEIIEVSGWTSATNGTNTYSNPAVDADISGGPFDGNIYMAFTNYGPEDAGRSDIDFIRSTDNAVTWSNRIQLNDDPNSGLQDSYHPWVFVNEDGVVIIIFYDTRFDSPSYLLFDLMAAYSFDGGQTLTANHRISSVSSDAGNLKRTGQQAFEMQYDEQGNPTVPVYTPMAGLIGEYIGVSAFHDKVNAVWTDSRDGNSEVYTANWYLTVLEPRLISPADSLGTNTEPEFSWATSWKHNQDRYRLEISDDSNFSSIIESVVTDTNFVTITSELTDGCYYWRVKTLNVSGTDSSGYSAARVLEIDKTPPSATTLLEPPDSSITNNPMPTFDWTDVSKAATPISYALYLSDIPDNPPIWTTIYEDISVSEFTPPDSLIGNVSTQWRVIAKDEAGNESTSEIWTVRYVQYFCGDVNFDGMGPNILDLNYFVNFLFRFGPAPEIREAADLDGGGGIPNIIDLNLLVNYIFREGPLPTCGE